MLGAEGKRVGQHLPSKPLEWLTDNGSAYRAHKTRAFARMRGLGARPTGVRSLESNGIAQSVVKTLWQDYISIMPGPDSQMAVINLPVAFSHYNGHHPHSRWQILLHGGFLAGCYRHPKREKVSEYMIKS